ncbi:MAG: hypothetical protein ACLGSA_00450 [Acidobacteriota bacterium]
MRTAPFVLLLASLLLPLTGCKMNTAMSTSEFYEFCLDDENDDCEGSGICSSYQTALSRTYDGVQSCVAECNRLDRELWMANVVDGCAGSVGNATDWCEQFCRRNYKK